MLKPALNFETELENKSLKYNTVHKTWGVLTLNAPFPGPKISLEVDFVVIIDTSASMRKDAKLVNVLATIDYLLTKLNSSQTLTLISFNDHVNVLKSLVPCTEENKEDISKIVKTLQAKGSTNIEEAIATGTEILRNRCSSNRISSIMLFTDGLSQRGSVNNNDGYKIPVGCTFNTFGFGADHDSSTLLNLALKSQGVYYYIDKSSEIASIFGECVAGILSVRAHQIKVRCRCRDGARIVTIATPFTITENVVAKDYGVNLELLYSGESKSILFRLSLRAMPKPMKIHPLVDVDIEYVDVFSGKREQTTLAISVERPDTSLLEKIPISLDTHINRYNAATSISEAVELAKKGSYTEAQNKLKSLISKIKQSASGNEDYCKDLTYDLQECYKAVADSTSFSTGMHAAHSYCSMYFMERSAGIKHRMNQNLRRENYGYTTPDQSAEAHLAQLVTNHLLSNYTSLLTTPLTTST